MSEEEEGRKKPFTDLPIPYQENLRPNNSAPSSPSYEFSESSVDLKVNFSDSEEDFPQEIHGPPTGFRDLTDHSFSENCNVFL